MENLEDVKVSPMGQIGDRWHKFMCYFLLWATAAYSIYQVAELYLTIDGEARRIIYGVFDIEWYVIFKDITTLLFALYSIVTAVMLIRMKQKAPTMVMWEYLIGAALVIIELAVRMTWTLGIGTRYIDLITLFAYLMLLLFNVIYYKRRARFFLS